MALTDNRTKLQDCENSAEVSGDTDATPFATTSETGLLIEGTNSISFQVTNAQEHILFDLDLNGATFTLDLSDSTIYIGIKDNLLNTFAGLGAQICLNDGADGGGGDDIGYNVGGSDAVGLPYRRNYNFYKLDVSVVVASPGTNGVDFTTYNGTEANLDQTAINQVGYGSNHLAKAVGTTPNAWFDGIYYIANDSYAATITGGSSGTPETMADVVGDDETAGAGMFSNPVGDIYYIFAPTEWGDATTLGSWFAGTDETWIFLGNNGGGHSVGATHFPMRIVSNATGTNGFVLTRVVLSSVGQRPQFNFNTANIDTFELDGCIFSAFGAITMPAAGGTSRFANSCIFNNCDQVYLSDLVCDGLIFNGSNDPLGAVLWDANADPSAQDNLTFNSDGTGHAIEISLNTASLTTFNISGYEVSGYETANDGTTGNTVFLVDNLLDGDVTINVSGGVGTFSYERAAGYTGTVTINQTVPVTITVVDTGGSPIQNAKIFLETTPGGVDIITYGITNASGQVSTTYGGATPQAVTGFVRKGTVSPVYKSSPINDTIGSTGLSATITLVADE